MHPQPHILYLQALDLSHSILTHHDQAPNNTRHVTQVEEVMGLGGGGQERGCGGVVDINRSADDLVFKVDDAVWEAILQQQFTKFEKRETPWMSVYPPSKTTQR